MIETERNPLEREPAEACPAFEHHSRCEQIGGVEREILRHQIDAVAAASATEWILRGGDIVGKKLIGVIVGVTAEHCALASQVVVHSSVALIARSIP